MLGNENVKWTNLSEKTEFVHYGDHRIKHLTLERTEDDCVVLYWECSQAATWHNPAER